MQNVFNTRASILHFLFCLLLTMVIHEKKIENYRKEGSDETAVCVLSLSLPWPLPLFSPSFLQAHILSCVNKGCAIDTLVLLLVLGKRTSTELLHHTRATSCVNTQPREYIYQSTLLQISYLLALKRGSHLPCGLLFLIRAWSNMRKHLAPTKSSQWEEPILQPPSSWYRYISHLSRWGQHWIYRRYAAQIIPHLWGNFYIIYQMCMIYSGSGGKMLNHSFEAESSRRDEKHSILVKELGLGV